MNASEFGLNTFSIGIMLLTHPERLQHYNDLWIDCAGDEWSADGSGWSGCPCFGFLGKLEFDTGAVGYFYGVFGSASAFLP